MKQPLNTLNTTRVLMQVRTLFYNLESNKKKIEREKGKDNIPSLYEGLSKLDLDLLSYLENG